MVFCASVNLWNASGHGKVCAVSRTTVRANGTEASRVNVRAITPHSSRSRSNCEHESSWFASSRQIEQDIRNHGEVLWKHAMHLLRLLLTGAATLREGRVPVRVEAHRERLLAVKRGEMAWPEVDAWRKELHRDFERALAETKLPERPDYEAANRFLIKARRETVQRQ